MKGYKQKLGILLLALMLALGSLGITHAHWVQIPHIGGTVTIGEGDPGFTGDWDFFQNPDDPDIDDEYYCTCNFTDSDDDGDLDVMEATITNVDPLCVYKLYSAIRNDGTLPMQITDIQIIDTGEVTIAEEETLVGTMINPGDEATCKLYIDIGEAMAGEYSFSVHITSCLWNQ